LDLEEVGNCQTDEQLFQYLYDAICHLDDEQQEETAKLEVGDVDN
jgi:hypothetical protein